MWPMNLGNEFSTSKQNLHYADVQEGVFMVITWHFTPAAMKNEYEYVLAWD